jgi:hypothetical protein
VSQRNALWQFEVVLLRLRFVQNLAITHLLQQQ